MIEAPAARRLGWRPGLFTASLLAVSLLVTAWLFTPGWWGRLGGDSRAFYAAASVASRGGDPYDFTQLSAQEISISQAAPDAGAFAATPYAYPPVATRLWGLLLGLGERGFYVANLLILLGAGIAGMEMLLAAASWQDRWLPRLFFLASPANVLGLVSGNPSNLLLLGLASGVLAETAGLPVAGGACLALGWLKPPIGIPVAVATIAGFRRDWRRLTAGLALGTAIFVLANLVAAGAAGFARWPLALADYSRTLTGPGVELPGQCCLVGLPAILFGIVPVSLATLIAVAAVAGLLLITLRGRAWSRRIVDPLFLPALFTAAVVAAEPYIHLNDLVLLALPLLLLASGPLTPPGRLTLVLWGLGPVLSLGLGLTLQTVMPPHVSFRLVLSLLTLAVIARLGGSSGRDPA